MFYLLARESYEQSNFLVSFCRRIASMFHVVLIILSMLLACGEVSVYISGPKRSLPVKIIQIMTFQLYLHKLRGVDIESLILK